MSIGYQADPSSVNRETVRCSELPSTATAGPSPLALSGVSCEASSYWRKPSIASAGTRRMSPASSSVWPPAARRMHLASSRSDLRPSHLPEELPLIGIGLLGASAEPLYHLEATTQRVRKQRLDSGADERGAGNGTRDSCRQPPILDCT